MFGAGGGCLGLLVDVWGCLWCVGVVSAPVRARGGGERERVWYLWFEKIGVLKRAVSFLRQVVLCVRRVYSSGSQGVYVGAIFFSKKIRFFDFCNFFQKNVAHWQHSYKQFSQARMSEPVSVIS